MDTKSLTNLLRPFVSSPLSERQQEQFSTYLDLLLKWNSKINLTSVRKPDEIITRHFGESLFAAEVLGEVLGNREKVLDFGSGAGFPGVPMKIAMPELDVTLAESQNKKAVFLREVVRSLGLIGVDVYVGRAERLENKFDVVTMRAVDEQGDLLAVASSLIKENGVLLLMIGGTAIEMSRSLLPGFDWSESRLIPKSDSRVVLIGRKPS